MIFSSLFAHLIFSDCSTFIDLDLQEIYKVIFTKSLPKYSVWKLLIIKLRILRLSGAEVSVRKVLASCKPGALGRGFAVTALGRCDSLQCISQPT